MVHLTRNRRDDERGIVLVLVALCMVVIMIFVAFAIDLSNTRQIRRQTQNAADSAALAGAQDLATLFGQSTATATAEATAKTYAAKVLGLTPDWASCTSDSGRPSGFAAAADTGCISFNSSSTKIRVRIPTRSVKSNFGQFAGQSSLAVSAA